MDENWKSTPDYEGLYEVSDLGRLRSSARIGTPGRVLTPTLNTNGYARTSLSKGGVTRSWYFHELVARAWLGPRPEGADIRHLDGNQLNNRVNNLAYGSRSENVRDTLVHGTNRNAAKTACKRGHAFDKANTIVGPEGGRQCRKCQNQRGAEYRSRLRAAATAKLEAAPC